MSSTTRRISENEIKKLKEIQKLLERSNIRMTQADLTQAMNDYILDHFNDFVSGLSQKKKKSSKDPLFDWLDTPISGTEDTNSVEDHDVII